MMENEPEIDVEKKEVELGIRDTPKKGWNLLWVFMPGVVIFLMELWKMLFVNFDFPGIYWLFVLLDFKYFWWIAIAIGGAILFFVLGAIRKIIQKPTPVFFSLAFTLFIVGIVFVGSFPLVLGSHIVHVKTARSDSLVYHLASYPLFDINYGIVQCGPLGLICRNIYRSYDITYVDWGEPSLSFDPKTDILTLSLAEQGILFAEEVP